MTDNTKWIILALVIIGLAIVLCLIFIPWGCMNFNSNARACGSCQSKTPSQSSTKTTLGQFPLTRSSGTQSYTISGSGLNTTINTSPSKSSFTYISPSTQSLANMVQPVSEIQVASDEGYTASVSDPTALLPDVSSTYDVDVTNPDTYCFRPSMLRSLKNRQFESSDMLRGDIPISVDNGQNGWFRSQYANRGSLRTDAYFSTASNCMNKAMLSRVENEGTIVEASPDYEIVT